MSTKTSQTQRGDSVLKPGARSGCEADSGSEVGRVSEDTGQWWFLSEPERKRLTDREAGKLLTSGSVFGLGYILVLVQGPLRTHSLDIIFIF